MTPISLRVERFGSFLEEQLFEFPRGPGLYFMQGINQVEPRLGGNGAGKTTIWSALFWLFFGCTPRGVKAGDAANWSEGKGAVVELTCSLTNEDSSLCWIRRTWSPNSWTIRYDSDPNEEWYDLTKDETNEVLQHLRLKPNAFLNCILMAQGQPMFLDQPSTMKTALFAEVMGLDRWITYSAKASKKASTEDIEIRKLERNVSEQRGRLAQLSDQKSITIEFDEWESKRRYRLGSIEGEYAERIPLAKKLKAEFINAQNAEVAARARYAELGKEFDVLHGALTVAQKEAATCDKDLALLDERVEALKKASDFLAKHDDQCPVCEQAISQDLRDAHDAKHVHTYLAQERQAKQAYAYLQEAKTRLNRAERLYEKNQKDLRQASEALDDAIARTKSCRTSHELQERQLDRLEEEAERIAAEVNPFAEMKNQRATEARQLREEIEELERQLDDAHHRHSLLNYWVKGFKEIRLQEIAAGQQQLEIEANNEVTALGLLDWRLLFDVDKETKGGSIQRGFTVRVESPHNPRSVPWEAWSGGESQRLRIAATMGLGNLIRGHSGTPLELEVWDEPTQWMSGQGVTDLLDALARRAQQEKRQIWVVDHRTLGYGNWSGICTVTKTRKGSRIQWEQV